MGIDIIMYAQLPSPLNEEAVRKLSYNLCSCFGAEYFWIAKEERNPHHALALSNDPRKERSHMQEIFPPNFPASGPQFLQVHLNSRFYGMGYERGNLPFILNVVDWLECQIPEIIIWYGGDGDDTPLQLLDKTYRTQLWTHFVKQGPSGYTNYIDERFGKYQRNCDFCREPMMNPGLLFKDEKVAVYTCTGCGLREETKDGGLTWAPYKEIKNIKPLPWYRILYDLFRQKRGS